MLNASMGTSYLLENYRAFPWKGSWWDCFFAAPGDGNWWFLELGWIWGSFPSQQSSTSSEVAELGAPTAGLCLQEPCWALKAPLCSCTGPFCAELSPGSQGCPGNVGRVTIAPRLQPRTGRSFSSCVTLALFLQEKQDPEQNLQGTSGKEFLFCAKNKFKKLVVSVVFQLSQKSILYQRKPFWSLVCHQYQKMFLLTVNIFALIWSVFVLQPLNDIPDLKISKSRLPSCLLCYQSWWLQFCLCLGSQFRVFLCSKYQLQSILKQMRKGEVKLADWLTGGYSNEIIFYSLHGLSMKVKIFN